MLLLVAVAVGVLSLLPVLRPCTTTTTTRGAERQASLSAARVASLEESLAAAQKALAGAQQRATQAAASSRKQVRVCTYLCVTHTTADQWG